LTAVQPVAAGASRISGIDLGLGAPVAVDDLTQIKGIGPAFAARLAEAGITTYSDLATAAPDQVATAAGVRAWQKVDPAAWTAEAARLAGRPRKPQIGDDLARLEGIGPAYATRLRAAGIINFRQLAESDEDTLAAVIAAPAWRRVKYGDWIEQARLAADGREAELKALQDRLNRRQGNNLELIQGVGSQYRSALENAGIATYADLAAASPEKLKAICDNAGLRAGNYSAWIEEAKLRAAGKRVSRRHTRTRPMPAGATQERSCPQDLAEIDGVGTIYEQRLFSNGIGTFWEVGMLSDDMLTDILEIEKFQDVDLVALKADALRLAQETNAMGHTWDGSEPDDFEVFEGIGPVLERRLYAAGICTYESLAEASTALLERVANAPAFQKPDYQLWIDQAQARLVQRAAGM
jgi:predicted flap endonuclease-1-like 5' DNA nuclease